MISIFLRYFLFVLTISMIHLSELVASDEVSYQNYSVIELPQGFETILNSVQAINDNGQIAGCITSFEWNQNARRNIKKETAVVWDPQYGLILFDHMSSSKAVAINNNGSVAITTGTDNSNPQCHIPYYWNPFDKSLKKGPTGKEARAINESNGIILATKISDYQWYYTLWDTNDFSLALTSGAFIKTNGEPANNKAQGITNRNDVSVYHSLDDIFIKRNDKYFLINIYDISGVQRNYPANNYSYWIYDNSYWINDLDEVAILFNKCLYIWKSHNDYKKIELHGLERNGAIKGFTNSRKLLISVGGQNNTIHPRIFVLDLKTID